MLAFSWFRSSGLVIFTQFWSIEITYRLLFKFLSLCGCIHPLCRSLTKFLSGYSPSRRKEVKPTEMVAWKPTIGSPQIWDRLNCPFFKIHRPASRPRRGRLHRLKALAHEYFRILITWEDGDYYNLFKSVYLKWWFQKAGKLMLFTWVLLSYSWMESKVYK